MSGEIVVASSLFHATAAAAPLLGAIVVGSLVYQAVKERREQARREAEQAARRRKRELQQCSAFQDTQQVRMQEQAARWQALQERLQVLRSADPPEAAEGPGRIHASGFLQQAQAAEQQRLRLQGLADLLAMRHRLKTRDAKAVYARKSTVETVFDIIKQVQGFRQFLLRGLGAVAGEWSLVCIGWNLKRSYALKG